jgi:hypothetical protein
LAAKRLGLHAFHLVGLAGKLLPYEAWLRLTTSAHAACDSHELLNGHKAHASNAILDLRVRGFGATPTQLGVVPDR